MNFGMTLASLAALLAAAIVGEAGQDGRVRRLRRTGERRSGVRSRIDAAVPDGKPPCSRRRGAHGGPFHHDHGESSFFEGDHGCAQRRAIGPRAPWPRLPLRAGHQRLPCVPSQRIRASGLKADGGGSHTRGYYWPTAFIREFIAVTKAHLWPYCALARPVFIGRLAATRPWSSSPVLYSLVPDDGTNGPVAQLVRAPPCHGGGHRFKSGRGRFFFFCSVFSPHCG